MPLRQTGRKGINAIASFREKIPLLLVVDKRALDFLTLRIGSARCDRSSFAIRRYHSSAADRNLSAFLDSKLQRVIVNLFVRPHIGIRIAGDRIVLAVELTGPLVMRRLSVAGGAVDRDFYAVARNFKNHC